MRFGLFSGGESDILRQRKPRKCDAEWRIGLQPLGVTSANIANNFIRNTRAILPYPRWNLARMIS
jgi:hypothetical protein